MSLKAETYSRETIQGLFSFYDVSRDADEPLKMYYSLVAYNGTDENELSLEEGKLVTVIDDRDSTWWLVREEETGKEGIIPVEVLESNVERAARKNCLRNLELSRPATNDFVSTKPIKTNKLVTFSDTIEKISVYGFDEDDCESQYGSNFPKEESKGWVIFVYLKIARMLRGEEITERKKNQIVRVHGGNFTPFPCYKTILASGSDTVEDLVRIFVEKFMLDICYEYQMYAVCEGTGYSMLIDPACTLTQAQKIAKLWVKRLNTRSFAQIFRSNSLSDLHEAGLRKMGYHSSESEIFKANSETFHFVLHRKLAKERTPFYVNVQVSSREQSKIVVAEADSRQTLGQVFCRALQLSLFALPAMGYSCKLASPSGKTVDPNLETKMAKVFELFPGVDFRQVKFIVDVDQSLDSFQPRLDVNVEVASFNKLFI